MFSNQDIQSLLLKLQLIQRHPALAVLLNENDTIGDEGGNVTSIATDIAVIYIGDTVKVDYDTGAGAFSLFGVEPDDSTFSTLLSFEFTRIATIVSILNQPAKPEPIPVMKPVEPTAPATAYAQ